MNKCMKQQKNRRLLFGYKIENGEKVIHAEEGGIVMWIYQQYCTGLSYLQITEKLKAGSVSYRGDNSSWNKNMVQRILIREEYCGMNGYPKLIEPEVYELAQIIRQKRAAGRAVKDEIPKQIRKLLRCGNCGSSVHREKSGKVMNWQCRREQKTTKEYITDEVLLEKLMQKTNQIIRKPEQLQISEEKTFELQLNMMQSNNEILRLMKERSAPKEEIETLIFQAAAERYRHCRTLDNTYYTNQLIALYRQKDVLTNPDFELIEHTVKYIYLNPDGELQFKMINEKLI